MKRKKTHEEYVEELAIKNPTIEVIGLYINAKTPISHRCLIHDIFWDISPTNALQGYGCQECKKVKISQKNRKTHQEYINEVNIINSNINVIGQYIDVNTPITHYCKKHDMFWDTTPAVILQGCGCPLCWREKLSMGKLKDHDEYVAKVAKINPNIEVVERYINARTKILHRCKIDGYEWYTYPYSTLSGYGCPKCAGNIKKTHNKYVEEVAKVNPDIEVIGEYMGAHIPILHKCKIHQYEWNATPNSILAGYSCPQCHETVGERRVRQWLEFNNFIYEYQKPFSDCIDQKVLPFDFYIPQYNLCVEYDGKQHFEPIDFANKGKEWALQQYKTRKRHDEIKTQYCKNNNIRLLRIPYFKNVEEELEKFFIHLI